MDSNRPTNWCRLRNHMSANGNNLMHAVGVRSSGQCSWHSFTASSRPSNPPSVEFRRRQRRHPRIVLHRPPSRLLVDCPFSGTLQSRLTAKDDRLKPSNPTTAAATPNANVVTSAIPTSEAPANTTSNDTSNAPLNAATVRGTAAGRVTISPRQSDFGGSSRGSCPAPNRDNTRGSGRGRSRRGLFGSGIRSARGKFVDRSEGGFRGRSQDGRMAASLLDTHSNAAWEGSGPTRVKVRSNGREDTPGNCEHEESEGGTRGGDVKEANSSIAVFGGDCRRNNRKRHRMSDVEGPKSSDSRQRATSGAMSRNKHGHRLPRRAQAGQRQVQNLAKWRRPTSTSPCRLLHQVVQSRT